MLELKFKTTAGTFPGTADESKQPRRQFLALVLLLATFGALIAKDHDFWFGSDDTFDSDVVSADSTPSNRTQAVAPAVRRPGATAAQAVKKQIKTVVPEAV